MRTEKLRRLAAAVAVVACIAATAGCARNSTTAPNTGAAYPPPPAAGTAPAPSYGSTGPWANPSTPAATYAVTASLHLRTAAGVNNTIIATLSPGTQVQATGSQQGGWWEVQTPQGTGWVSSRYLSPG